MKKVFSLLLAAVMISLCVLSVSAGVDVKTTEKRIFENGNTVLPYRLVLPETYDETKSYPMLVFLHGAGERGNDNELQLFHCVQYLADTLPECIIVAPQCPANNQWVDTPWANGAYSIDKVPESNELKAVVELLDTLQEEFNVDADRIYASGLSMGGFGAWDLMMRHNDYFAAGVLVCGGGDLSRAEALKDTPLFVFHGDADPTVPVSGSRDVVQAIRDAGGELVQYVEYAGQGHGIWNAAFAHPGMLQELMTYKLSTRYPPEESEEESVEESVEESEEATVSQPTSSEAPAEQPETSPMGWIIALSVLGVIVLATVILLVLKKKKG